MVQALANYFISVVGQIRKHKVWCGRELSHSIYPRQLRTSVYSKPHLLADGVTAVWRSVSDKSTVAENLYLCAGKKNDRSNITGYFYWAYFFV